MKKIDKYLKVFIKYFIALIIFSFISLILLISLYDFEVNNITLSNALFISNVLIFVTTIGINVGAGNIFNPLKYMFKKVFSRKGNDKVPRTYVEYLSNKELKQNEYKSEEPWYLTYASLTLLIIAYILSVI